ncbi:FkbM family methyltransferase [Thalassobaculum sp.]|uniref:FkbM family methyltransferase n=1 Tax=Thalassobaculum sp. TaxID=2022740 RepID=UPI0032F07570
MALGADRIIGAPGDPRGQGVRYRVVRLHPQDLRADRIGLGATSGVDVLYGNTKCVNDLHGHGQFRRGLIANQRRRGCRTCGHSVYADREPLGAFVAPSTGARVIATSSLPVLTMVGKLRAAGRNGDAGKLIEAYCERRPDDVQGRFLLALIRRDLGDGPGAKSAIEPILGERRAPIQHLAGLIARDHGDDGRSVARFKRALLCDPGHAGAWQALSRETALDVCGVRWATAAAIVDPADVDAWAGLVSVILVSNDVARSHSLKVLASKALGRAGAMMAATAPAVTALTCDRPVEAAKAAECTEDTETAITRLVDQAAARFCDIAVVQARLDLRLKQLATQSPQDRSNYLALLALHGRNARPDDQGLMRHVRRVIAFGNLHASASDLRQTFTACVAAKNFAMREIDTNAAMIVGHALGLQALCEQVGRPIELRWSDGARHVRIGDREVSYTLSSSNVIGFVSRLFLFEPGLWRWMAGFDADDVLLDIGANVGIYSIAAAGLFGARVAALEPYAPNLQTLRQNVAVNHLDDRITILPIAATDVEQTGRLFHDGGAAGAAAQHFESSNATPETAAAFDTVEGVPVDLLIDRGTIPFPTRIKIDVDGNERAVIEGMTRTLADPRLHSVRLEVHWWDAKGRAVVERVKAFGFRVTVDDDQKNLLFTRTTAPAKT